MILLILKILEFNETSLASVFFVETCQICNQSFEKVRMIIIRVEINDDNFSRVLSKEMSNQCFMLTLYQKFIEE